MFKNAVGRIVRVGKGAVFLAGFAGVFAVVFAAANALLGVWGGQPLFGGSHRANPVTQLAPRTAGRGWTRNPWCGGDR